jgi:hypothetical protein
MCRFVVENVRPIFNNHDFILATGTTGGWIKKFAIAAGRDPAEVDEKVRLCVREELTKCVEAVLAEVMNQRGDVGNRFGVS